MKKENKPKHFPIEKLCCSYSLKYLSPKAKTYMEDNNCATMHTKQSINTGLNSQCLSPRIQQLAENKYFMLHRKQSLKSVCQINTFTEQNYNSYQKKGLIDEQIKLLIEKSIQLNKKLVGSYPDLFIQTSDNNKSKLNQTNNLKEMDQRIRRLEETINSDRQANDQDLIKKLRLKEQQIENLTLQNSNLKQQINKIQTNTEESFKIRKTCDRASENQIDEQNMFIRKKLTNFKKISQTTNNLQQKSTKENDLRHFQEDI